MIPAGMPTLGDAEALLAGLLELVEAMPEGMLRLRQGPAGTVVLETEIPNALMAEAVRRLQLAEALNEQTDDAGEEARS